MQPSGLYFDRFTNLLFDSGSNLYLDQQMQNLFHWDPFSQRFSSVESSRKYMHRLALLRNSAAKEKKPNSNAEKDDKSDVEDEDRSAVKRKLAEKEEKKEKLVMPVTDESSCATKGEDSELRAQPFDPASDVDPPQPDKMTFDSSLGAFLDRITGLYYDPRTSLFYDYDRTHPAAVFHYCRSTNEYMRVHVDATTTSADTEEPVFEGVAEVSPSRPPRDRFYLLCLKSNDDRFLNQKIVLGESAKDVVITIGRDKKNTISFSRDVETSNFHAKIELQTVFWKTTVYISDVGSRNGTFLNGTRLSDSKVSSADKTTALKEGDVLLIGKNEFRFCTEKVEASASDVIITSPATSEPLPPVENQNAERRKRMMRLTEEERKHRRAIATQYEDRAGARREAEEDLAAPAPASATPAIYIPRISMNNAGYKMLTAMGWQKGTGLGRDEAGIQQPVKPVVVKGRQGLGFGT